MARAIPVIALLLLACSRRCASESDSMLLSKAEQALCHVSHSGLYRTGTATRLKGAKSVPTDTPWKFTALVVVDVRPCSGAILSSKYVLTNGYCTQEFDKAGGLVLVGGYKYMTPEDLRDRRVQIREIEDVSRYEAGTDNHMDHDIAVVTVYREFIFNLDVQPAILLKSVSVVWPIHCTMLGFGETFDGDTAHVLSASNVTLTGPEHCCSQIRTYELGANAACALETDNAMCWGDMGGPIVDNKGFLTALVAYKTPTNPTLMQCGQPVDNAFFMFLGYYHEWLGPFTRL